MLKWIGISLLVINFLGFSLMGFDKRRARANKMRVNEGVLLSAAICFGSLGVFLGSKLFHHKTKVKAFSLTLPLLMILQLSWLWLFYKNGFKL